VAGHNQTERGAGVVARLVVVAAIAAAGVGVRLVDASPASGSPPTERPSVIRAERSEQVVDDAGCASMERWEGLEPIANDPAGDIEAIWATSDADGDLLQSRHLFVRVDVKPGVPIHRLLIDVDSDRMTGMWTAQSHLSDSGWDHLVDSAALYRYGAERPNMWSWNNTHSKDLRTPSEPGRFFFCIPLDDLPATDAVLLTAESSYNSLPLRFLGGARYPQAPRELRSERVRAPKRMAFYYSGSPWIVRECSGFDQTDVACAVDVFSNFRHVVFGARLEEATRSGHAGATNLMHGLRRESKRTELWGYISFIGSQKNPDGTRDMLFDLDYYIESARAWKEMGATGIFLDEYDVCDPAWQRCRKGPDGEGVLLTRQRQVEIVEAIHDLGLAVFANSHSVQNALGEIDGIASPLGPREGKRPADMYLLENPTVVFGRFHGEFDREAHMARFAQAVELTQATGARLGVLDSMDGFISDAAESSLQYQIGWWQAAQAGASAYAFFGENLAILDPPDGAEALIGLRFDRRGIRFALNGDTSERGLVDGCGSVVGAIKRVVTGDLESAGVGLSATGVLAGEGC
jgi:hypothetical protein